MNPPRRRERLAGTAREAELAERLDRAEAALAGVALGDALGMPAQTLTRPDIRARYGRISGLVAPFADHPVSHGLGAGAVTDDTEQTLLLARHLIDQGGRVEPYAWGRALLDWEAGVRARGLRDLLGPSSKAALEALAAGADPAETGRRGTTNGAAMRIVPVGIMTPPDPGPLAAATAAAAQVTHATREAISAAAAVAMVVSRGVEGASFDAALPDALAAARAGAALGAPVGEADMAGRIEAALEAPDEATLAARIGTSVASRESVPCAFGIVRLAGGDPWRAALLAANIGDDTDTIGAIACGMAAACAGLAALPAGPLAQVVAVNRLDLRPLAEGLLALRERNG